MATLKQELRSIQTPRPIFSYQDSIQLSGNISPNPRPDEETRQSTDHLCFSLKEKKV